MIDIGLTNALAQIRDACMKLMTHQPAEEEQT